MAEPGAHFGDISTALTAHLQDCVKILREAVAARRVAVQSNSSDMFCDSGSEAGEEDSDSGEDEDESSMMNWVMPDAPLPASTAAIPGTNLTNQEQILLRDFVQQQIQINGSGKKSNDR